MFAYTIDELYGMYATYNDAMGVGQLVAWGVMFAMAGAAYAEKEHWNKWISLFLGVSWIWVGVVYHWLFYMTINPAAKYFAAGFVLQGLLIVYEGIKEKNLWFGYRGGYCAVMGTIFVMYALVGYPLLSLRLGQGYPEIAAYFLAPVPVTVYTLGLLLLTFKRVP
ncbi:hypothetical protein KJ564_16495, partial [bacterium]|nr:hypothetical protein [bacterium]